jgi:predicted PurR-regulated permease PerM
MRIRRDRACGSEGSGTEPGIRGRVYRRPLDGRKLAAVSRVPIDDNAEEGRRRGPFFSNAFVARASRWGLVAWSLIGLLILIGVVYRFVLYPIRIIFPPLVIALIVIYLMNPVVTALQRRGVRRIWGTLLVYLVFLSIVGVAVAYLSAVIGKQVTQFVDSVPALLAKAQHGLNTLSDRLGVKLDTEGIARAFEPKNGSAFAFLGRLTSFTTGAVHVAFFIVLGPLIAFYLLVDLPKLRRGAEALVPESRRAEVQHLAERVGDTLGGFFRGQFLVALIVGLVSMLGFYLVGMPYFALLGAVTGLVALVPLIGTLIAAVPTLFVAFTATGRGGRALLISGGWKLALAAAIVLILAQQLDTRLLSPRLKSRAVRLHPVTVLLSLLLGGTLLGLWGMLLAVPVVAAAKVILLHVWDTRSQWPPRVDGLALPKATADPLPSARSEPPTGRFTPAASSGVD